MSERFLLSLTAGTSCITSIHSIFSMNTGTLPLVTSPFFFHCILGISIVVLVSFIWCGTRDVSN